MLHFLRLLVTPISKFATKAVDHLLALHPSKIMFFFVFYKKLFDNYGVKNIFLGNKHSSTHLHSEIASSCALQLSGIKKWYLINPEYSVQID